MTFCFVFGLEPWLLPPAVEMIEALKSSGHGVKVIYAVYQGSKPDKKDFNTSDIFEIVSKHPGAKRLFIHHFIAASVKKLLAQSSVDVIIACDILSLQAVNEIKGPVKGYWGFEIVSRPEKMKLSLGIYRAFRFPAWVENCDFFLSPSESRGDKISARCKKNIPHEVIYNCRLLKEGTGSVSGTPGKLVYTGRISETQYISEIIDAIALVPGNVELHLAGPVDAGYECTLVEKIKNNSLSHKVFLLGRLSREDAYALIDTADIGFVFYNENMGPEAQDPAPNKLSDYIAGNTWTLGGDQPYMKYWLEERGAGLCIKTMDSKSIADGIKELLNAPQFKDKALLHQVYKNELNMYVQAEKLVMLVNTLI